MQYFVQSEGTYFHHRMPPLPFWIQMLILIFLIASPMDLLQIELNSN